MQIAPENLAEECFKAEYVSDKLFQEVHKIMGGEWPINENTTYPVLALDTDAYDSSIEVVLQADTEWMTREQADAILALGFSGIYESSGEKCRHWSKDGKSWTSAYPREGDQDFLKIVALKAKLAEAAKTNPPPANHPAMHASVPEGGFGCADCSIDKEPCPTCYSAWWRRRHPNINQSWSLTTAHMPEMPEID